MLFQDVLKTDIWHMHMHIHRALQAREGEVNRLAELLEDDLVQGKSKAAARAANSKIIEQLNNQVDFLNGQLALKEAQIQNLMGEEIACGKEARRVLQVSKQKWES